MNRYTEKFLAFSEKLSDNMVVSSVTNGLVIIVPFMLAGSFAVLLNHFPLSGWDRIMTSFFGKSWREFGDFIWNGCFGIMSIFILLTITYSLAKKNFIAHECQINPGILPFVSLTGFIIITQFTPGQLSFSSIGPNGIVIAILASIVTVSLLSFFYKHRIFKVKVVTDDADPLVAVVLSSIEPVILTLVVFSCMRCILNLFGVSDINLLFQNFFGAIFTKLDSGYFSGLLFNIIAHIFWFFGIHGNNLLDYTVKNFYIPNLEKNMEAVANGTIPNEIFTKPFFDVFVYQGGCGGSLCLLVAVLIIARKSNIAGIIKFSFLPCLFNISEILVFGLPIVLNPILLIPFLLVPLILTTTTFLAMISGLVPLTTIQVEWTTPSLIGGYLTTGSFRGVLLVLFNFFIGVLVYCPFVKLMEIKKERKNKKALRILTEEIVCIDTKQEPKIIVRNDITGNLARILANDMVQDIRNSEAFFLEYQPQVDYRGIVIGAEALLRWKHQKYGRISPPVTVLIAQESGFIDELGNWIIHSSCAQLARLNQLQIVDKDFVLSLNVSPMQLRNPNIVKVLVENIRKYQLVPERLKIEFTENIAVDHSSQTQDNLNQLKELGVRLAIDDFGMGHSSLLYIKEFQVDTLKFDGSLVKDIVYDKNSRGIISSIIHLCDSLKIKTIAEFVETKEQRDVLRELGCNIYQGYYFSRPLASEEFFSFLKQDHRGK